MSKKLASQQTTRRTTRRSGPSLRARACSWFKVQGTRKPGLPGSARYEVCLSPNQYRVLFGGREVRKLGCGTFACAYDMGDHVVKLTIDKEDIAALLELQGNPRVVRMSKAVELVDAGKLPNGKPIQVYAVKAEKLKPPSPKLENWIDKLFATSEDAYHDLIEDAQDWAHSNNAASYPGPTDKAIDGLYKLCDRDRGCKRFVDEFVLTFTQMTRKGVLWQDLHHGNFGVDSRGRWKALDLGVSEKRLIQPLPQLADAIRKLNLKKWY